MSQPGPNAVEELRAASRRLSRARAGARRAGISAVRRLEAALLRALEGGDVRGMPELAPGLRAVRVRSGQGDLPEPLPGRERGREVLVLGADGRLWMASAGPYGVVDVRWRQAQDADLLAEDALDFPRAVAGAVREHVARTRRTAERFERLISVAELVASAVR